MALNSEIKGRGWLYLISLLIVLGGQGAINTHWGDSFWWQGDAPRHALNGAFVRDFVVEGGFLNPLAYAELYYAHYPALTIMFYPPLFYLIEAIFFLIFGVAESVARLTVFSFYLFGVVGFYMLLRERIGRSWAFLATLMLFSSRGIVFWSREVMLDIPLLSLEIWAVYFFFRYLKDEKGTFAILTSAFLLLALYVKQTALFIAPVMLLHPAITGRREVYRNREVIYAVLGAFVLLLPLAALTLKFGRINFFQSLSSKATGNRWPEKYSMESLVFYFKHLPELLGYPILISVVASLLVLPFVLKSAETRSFILEQREFLVFLLLWMGANYLFFTYISVKEPRHFLGFLPPLVSFVVLIVSALNRHKKLFFAVFVGLVFMAMVDNLKGNSPFVSGMDSVSREIIASNSGGTILYCGHYNGDFIFSCRRERKERDMVILRASKVLFSSAVYSEWKYREYVKSFSDMDRVLRELAVQQILVEEPFTGKSSLEPLKVLESYIHSGKLRFVKRFELIKYDRDAGQRAFYVDLWENPDFNLSDFKGVLKIPLPLIRKTIEVHLDIEGK